MRSFFLLLQMLSLLIVIGCGAGQWKMTTSYGGKTTVKGDAKTMEQEKIKRSQQTDFERRIRGAERRGLSEPLRVALYPPSFSDALKAKTNPNKVLEILKKEFGQHNRIKLVDYKLLDKWAGSSGFIGSKALLADIIIKTHIFEDESYGIVRTTGQVAKYPLLVLKGQVQSNYLAEDKFVHKESGHVLLNAKILNRYARNLLKKVNNTFHIPNEAFRKSLQEENSRTFDDVLKRLKESGS